MLSANPEPTCSRCGFLMIGETQLCGCSTDRKYRTYGKTEAKPTLDDYDSFSYDKYSYSNPEPDESKGVELK